MGRVTADAGRWFPVVPLSAPTGFRSWGPGKGGLLVIHRGAPCGYKYLQAPVSGAAPVAPGRAAAAGDRDGRRPER
jgi:hypothetical protein